MNVLSAVSIIVGIALLPIYLWESGSLQISHIALALGCASYIGGNGLRPRFPEKVLAVLALFVFVRESTGALGGVMDVRAFLPPLYMLFNLIVFMTIKMWAATVDNQKLLAYGLLASAAVAASGVFVLGYGLSVDVEGGRAVGTFNNPNQLGYFAVCLYSCAVLLFYGDVLSLRAFLALLLVSAFLVMVSLSKAATVGLGASLVCVCFGFGRPTQRFLYGVFGGTLLLSLAVYLYAAGYLDGLAVTKRILDIGSDSDDSLAGRGYHVLYQARSWEIFFGLGESGVKEFVGHELHSTVGSILANYGLIGAGLFVVFLVLWAKRLLNVIGLAGLFVVGAPPMLYGLTHNGIRFTMFWVFLGLSFAVGRAKRSVVPASGPVRLGTNREQRK